MIRIHDHFDGSAHCIECGGPCRLPDDERRVTSLVRYLFESSRYMNMMMRSVLEEFGVDIPAFQKRASETSPWTPNTPTKGSLRSSR